MVELGEFSAEKIETLYTYPLGDNDTKSNLSVTKGEPQKKVKDESLNHCGEEIFWVDERFVFKLLS